jgi:F-type H+-transporting ATPase subunit b
MAEPTATSAGTTVPAQKGGAFPPFKTETYPAQLFWLVLTFAVLFIVMWRIVVPRIGGAIGDRKAKIAGDLSLAEAHRKAAEQASAAYDAAIASARQRALAAANDNRAKVNAEVDRAKAAADAQAAAAMAKAEESISASRIEARGHVANAARDAAIQIVTRLTGDTVSADDAAAAVRASQS